MVVRLLAVLIFTGALTVPIVAYWIASRPHQPVSAQVAFHRVRVRPPGAGPTYRGVIVLTFHNVLPGSTNPYTVAPRRFALDIAALAGAGYHTVSGRTMAAYLSGRRARLPSRAILLTFDDGAKGDWIYADPILRAYRYRAALFTITHAVGTHQPYYVNWGEIRRMSASGRWDIESHTRAGHGFVPSGPGSIGAFLTNMRWRNDGRLESEADWRRRVTDDLRGSIADIVRHGLPRPELFAFPFSATTTPTNDPAIPGLLRRITRGLFVGSFQDDSHPYPLRPGDRSLLPRLEVFADTTPRQLLARLARCSRRSQVGLP